MPLSPAKTKQIQSIFQNNFSHYAAPAEASKSWSGQVGDYKHCRWELRAPKARAFRRVRGMLLRKGDSRFLKVGGGSRSSDVEAFPPKAFFLKSNVYEMPFPGF